jgi:hypothetical protein
LDKQCSHGKPWDEPCLRCELVSEREFVASMAPRVERAKERIKELERSILADELEEARQMLVGPNGGPYVRVSREGAQ